MNLILLLVAFIPGARSASSLLLRVFLAIGAFSLEMQVVTLTSAGSLRGLIWLNAAIAVAAVGRVLFLGPAERWRVMFFGSVKWQVQRTGPALQTLVAFAALGVLVAALNAIRPVAAADPYHLHRIDQIERLGTLAYDGTAPDVKTNILAGTYELVLADLRTVPVIGSWLFRFHGVLGLVLYAVAIAAAFECLGTRSSLAAMALLCVPVVFHQFVLIKNDLFDAVPACAALVWLIKRGKEGPPGELAAAAWLAGFAVGVKVSSFPVALTMAGGVMVLRRDWRAFAWAAAAGTVGAIAAGVLLTAVQNTQTYGAVLQPYAALGNRHTNLHDALVDVARLAISFVDLGIVTRTVWPGRGGWGGTFGVTLIWAIAVLVVRRARPEARRALGAAAACFLMFALVYPDADLAHRLILAPGLLLIAVAGTCIDDDHPSSPMFRRLLVVAVVLSVAQIARSAVLYLSP